MEGSPATGQMAQTERPAAAVWEAIRHRLAGVPAPTGLNTALRRAAVLVPLSLIDGEIVLLLTQRTQAVAHHKGQISFPGGAADEGEELLDTALRETFEEVGIPPDQVQILGMLPEVEVAVSRFRVTPFVGVIPHLYPVRPSADEIEELVSVPLAVFRDPANLRVEVRQWEGRSAEVYYYSHHARTVWGATARIIKLFVELVGEI